MVSTVRYFKSGKINVSETLRETAKSATGMRGTFHAKDILFALQSQGIETITEQQIRNLLSYSGSAYKNSKLSTMKRTFCELRKLEAGWFTWVKYEYNPNPDIERGEANFTIIR